MAATGWWQEEILRAEVAKKLQVVGLGLAVLCDQLLLLAAHGHQGTGGDKAARGPGRGGHSELRGWQGRPS